MPRTTECTREQVLVAVHKGRGKTSLVAHLLDVSEETVRNYAKRWKTVADAIHQERISFDATLIDKAEVKLEEAVMQGKAWAVKYALDRKGEERGYTPKSKAEITGEGGGPIAITEIVVEHPAHAESVED